DFAGTQSEQLQILECDTAGIKLAGATLVQSLLLDCDLSQADLAGVMLRSAVWMRVDLTGRDLSQFSLDRVQFAESNLERANLAGLDFKGGISFFKAKLGGATLEGARADNINLVQASLV